MNKKSNNSAMLVLIGVVASILVVLILIFIIGLRQLRSATSGKSQPRAVLQSQSSASSSSSSSSAQTGARTPLQNAELQVGMAEVFFDDDDITAAQKAITALPQSQRASFQSRLEAVKVSQKKREALRLTTAPRPDMIMQNPAKPFFVVGHYSNYGMIASEIPDLDQYSEEDIIKIFGKPTAVITDKKTVIDDLYRLTASGDLDKNHQSKELERLITVNHAGQLTKSEAEAFSAQLLDVVESTQFEMPKTVMELDYQAQGKPNVYFFDGKIMYATPITRYYYFPRLSDLK